jgi:hypothetical protein
MVGHEIWNDLGDESEYDRGEFGGPKNKFNLI